MSDGVIVHLRETRLDGGYEIERVHDGAAADATVTVDAEAIDRWNAAETAWTAAQAEMRALLEAEEEKALGDIPESHGGPRRPVRSLLPMASCSPDTFTRSNG